MATAAIDDMSSADDTSEIGRVVRSPLPTPSDPDAASILVVDDDRASRLAMAAILDGIGDRGVCAGSGEEALRCLLREDFAIVLLDVVMPDMSGYEAAEMIRRRERSRYVPIIFMSAINKDQRHMFEGYSAGAVDYVFKPVEPTIVRSKASVFVELHRKSVELRHKAESEKLLLAENLRVRTEQMRTAEALHRSLTQQSLVIDALPIVFYVASAADDFTQRRFVGGRTKPTYGFPAERFERNPNLWFERIRDADRDGVRRSLARLRETGQFYAEYRWLCGDGIWRHFLDHGTIVGTGDGQEEMFGTSLDVTERRLLEQQLAHVQKMEVLGQLTSGIAHDFNNMLTVVIGSLDRLRQLSEPSSRATRHIDLALHGALSCADLTRRLLGFARRQPLQPKALDLTHEVERLRELLERMLPAGMRMCRNCDEALWTVVADPLQIEAAVVNLVANARDAMPEDGVVTISTRNRTIDPRTASVSKIPAGDYVELSVSDTGAGMSPEVLEHAFDPFFTTKQAGKGTGLGLSTIYGFVRQSNGGVRIESEVGQGTSIRIYLPRAEAIDAEPEYLPAARTDASNVERKVLVVDDDHEVRAVAVALLRDLGYAVVDAGDGHAGLALLKSDPGIALLFTDWAMPGMDGRQLAARVAELRPQLPVLFTSGNANEILSGSGVPPDIRFLAQPYRRHDLAEAIREALAAARFR